MFQGKGMIKSIELQNWKTHLDSKLEFEKGTNVLVGNMGSGKTSVMDAICFSLFGTFPALQQRRIALQEIIMAKPNQMEQAAIKLEFRYGEKEFRVERTIKEKGSSEAKLFVAGKLVAGPKPKDVNEAIERELEISYNLFSRAVYSEQNQIDYFLRLSPGQRKEKFDELLELDKYEAVRGNAVTALNRLKAMAEDKAKWLQELEAGSKGTDIKELEKRVAEKEKEIEELGKKEAEQKKALEEAKQEARKLEEKEKKFNGLQETAMKSAYLAEKLESEVKDEEKKLEGWDAEAFQKSLEEKKDSAKKAEEQAEALEKDSKQLIEKASAARQEIKGNQAKIAEIGEQEQHLHKAGANCPVCKTSLGKEKKESVEKQNKQAVAELEAKNSELSGKAGAMEKEQAEKEKETQEKKLEKEKLESGITELEKLIEAGKKLSEKKAEAKKATQEAEKAKKEIQELGFEGEKAKETKEQVIKLEAGTEANAKEMHARKELLESAKRELENAEKTAGQVKQLREQVSGIEQSCGKLQLFTNSLRETQAQLRESLIETINEAMDSIWQSIYPYGDYTSAKMRVDEGNYELVVRDKSGKWVRVEGILSGGERSAAAICIRIAFSLVLTRNLSWLILDEPTHNLDSTAVSTLGKMMRESLPELIQQVFVITHDKEMEKAASGTLHMLSRNKENDEPTQVEALALEN